MRRESVDDPLSIQGKTNSNVSENIVTEVKEEVIGDESLCLGHNTGDEENNTVVDDIDIDIVEHKIEIDD